MIMQALRACGTCALIMWCTLDHRAEPEWRRLAGGAFVDAGVDTGSPSSHAVRGCQEGAVSNRPAREPPHVFNWMLHKSVTYAIPNSFLAEYARKKKNQMLW